MSENQKPIPLGAAFSHARASGKDQSQAAQRRRANEWLKREGKATMSRKVAKGILGRWRAMTTDERADEFNLRAAGVPPDVARALAMTGNGKAPKRKPKFSGQVSKMGPTLAELDAPGHTHGLTGSSELRGATWRKRRRWQKRIDKGGPGSGPHAGGGTSVASHLSAARSHLAAAKLARGKGAHATADSHQQRASARIQAALTARSVAKTGEFEESKHPRADDGKFGEGGGGGRSETKQSQGEKAAHELHAKLKKDGISGKKLAAAHAKMGRKAQAAADLLGGDDDKKAAFFQDKATAHLSLAKQAKGVEQKENKPAPKAESAKLKSAYAKKFSDEQHAALRAYTKQHGVRSGYEDINDALAGTLPKHVQGDRRAAAEHNAKHINTAIAAAKTVKPTTVYRGGPVTADLKPGDTIQSPRITSTTSEKNVAEKYAEMGSKPGASVAVLHISVPSGTPLLDVNKTGATKIRGEKEQLMASNQRLKVVSVDRSKSPPEVHCEAINDDPAEFHSKIKTGNSKRLREELHKTAIAKRHMVSQIAGQMIAAAYEPPRLPAGAPTYTDPPEFARYLDAQRLVAGMDTELSVDGTQTPAQARARASRALATSMGAYDRTIAGQDRALAHVGGLNLDLGSGQARERGFLGIDLVAFDYATVVADLGMGIPFPDGSARAVRLMDALSSMPDYTADATPLMVEVQRVLGIGGRFYYRGPPLQDIVDWAKLPGLGVVSHQFIDGGKTLSLTLQRQAARLPLVFGADVEHLSRPEALPSDIAEARAEFGDLPPASVAMANLVAKQHVDVQASIVRKRDYDRVVLGPILIPDLPDSQNDTMTARDIEETAHNFLADARLVGREHSDTWEGAQVVESYIAPCELSFADEMYGPQVVPKGSWILGVRIPEESWADVLDGSVTGFSVGGWGEREDLPTTAVTT